MLVSLFKDIGAFRVDLIPLNEASSNLRFTFLALKTVISSSVQLEKERLIKIKNNGNGIVISSVVHHS